MDKHTNDLETIPAAACPRCGGWTACGGMSEHWQSDIPVLGRTGCDCNPRDGQAHSSRVRARLDADAAAKPLTRLVGHARSGDCVGPHVQADAIEDETGSRTEL